MSELGRTSGIYLVTDWFRVKFTSEDEDCLAECILLVEDSLFVSSTSIDLAALFLA
jgi:hypothetical protein